MSCHSRYTAAVDVDLQGTSKRAQDGKHVAVHVHGQRCITPILYDDDANGADTRLGARRGGNSD